MKKVILVMVFALASFSINGGNILDTEAGNSCEKYAMDSATAEHEAYDSSIDVFNSDYKYYLIYVMSRWS